MYVLREEKFGGLLYNRSTLDIKVLDKIEFERLKRNADNIDLITNGNLDVLSAPTKLFLTLTKRCNLYCLHCCNNSMISAEEELSYQEVQNIITHCKNIGIFEIGVNGGEPLCHPEFFRIVKAIKENGLSIYLNTNGIHGSTVLEKLSESGIDKIKVSIDGLEEINDQMRGKGTFRKAINTIRYLIKKGRNVRINHTLSRKNKSDILNMVDLSNELGCNIKIAPLVNAGRAKKLNESEFSISEGRLLAKQIEEHCSLKKIKVHVELRTELLENTCSDSLAKFNFQYTDCGVRHIHLSIDSSGMAYSGGCQTEFDELGPLGNIRNESVSQLWAKAKHRNVVMKNKFMECRGCNTERILIESFS